MNNHVAASVTAIPLRLRRGYSFLLSSSNKLQSRYLTGFDNFVTLFLDNERIRNGDKMMAAPKIADLITSCGKCPFYGYYSGGVYRCERAQQIVRDPDTIALFCPLPDYPAEKIAELEATIIGLRKSKEHGFGLELLTYVATKLKLHLNASCSSITLPLKDGKNIILSLDCVRNITIYPFEINFSYDGRFFRLLPDADLMKLFERSPQTGAKGEDLWLQVPLAQ